MTPRISFLRSQFFLSPYPYKHLVERPIAECFAVAAPIDFVPAWRFNVRTSTADMTGRVVSGPVRITQLTKRRFLALPTETNKPQTAARGRAKPGLSHGGRAGAGVP